MARPAMPTPGARSARAAGATAPAARERAALLAAAQRLDGLGFMPSKSGNLSLRTPRGFLITPSGLPYAETGPEDLVEVMADGTVVVGSRAPSSEWRLHAAVYADRPEAMAVVHTHSPCATALSCARQGIPPLHYMIVLGGGSDIRCADYATFGTEALARNCVAALAGRRAVLLANHGVVAFGRGLSGAVVLAMEVENLARQYLALRAAGLPPVLLDERELAETMEQFGGYGRAG